MQIDLIENANNNQTDGAWNNFLTESTEHDIINNNLNLQEQ